jgi:cytochrome c oxidase subunit 2
MSFTVVAESQGQFDSWRMHQLQPAPAAQTPEQMRGQELVEYRCGLCHKVRGTTAGALSAPDLTHVMSRTEIAAGTLPNNPGTLAGWILDPQALKPGTLMPAQGLAGTQLADTVAYLETLK